MSLRLYLFFMSVGTLLCWIAWFFVLGNIAPEEAGFMGMSFFYLSLFLALLGTSSVIGFLIKRRIVKNDDLVFRHVSHTFRQGVLIASFACIVLYLMSKDVLAWWNLILLVILFLMIEGIIFTKRKFNNVDYVQ